MEMQDLCGFLVGKEHRTTHLVVIFKDAGNMLKIKKDTKVKGLCICNEHSKTINNCKTLGKDILMC